MKNAVIVSAQFLVELPESVPYTEAESFGCDWLTGLDTGCLDYRHPQIMGIYLRPVPVQVRDEDSDDIFQNGNLIQL